jgi:hypothetical protein
MPNLLGIILPNFCPVAQTFRGTEAIMGACATHGLVEHGRAVVVDVVETWTLPHDAVMACELLRNGRGSVSGSRVRRSNLVTRWHAPTQDERVVSASVQNCFHSAHACSAPHR